MPFVYSYIFVFGIQIDWQENEMWYQFKADFLQLRKLTWLETAKKKLAKIISGTEFHLTVAKKSCHFNLQRYKFVKGREKCVSP